MQKIAFTSIACGFAIAATAVIAQPYPYKPVRILSAEVGGGADLAARVLAQSMSTSMGRQFVVENRPGRLIGEMLAKATPDGYTLLLVSSTILFAPLFGVLLADHFIVRRRRVDSAGLASKGGAYWFTGGLHLSGLAAWAIGIGAYQALSRLAPIAGATLPAFLVAAVVYILGFAWRGYAAPACGTRGLSLGHRIELDRRGAGRVQVDPCRLQTHGCSQGGVHIMQAAANAAWSVRPNIPFCALNTPAAISPTPSH